MLGLEVRDVQRTLISLIWQDLRYAPEGYSSSNSNRIDIVRGISGCAVPGRLLAILGPSGAGKTTMMDVLAGRKTAGSRDGKLLVNGENVANSVLRSVSGYVLQEDAMLGALTVRETLTISARLRLPKGAPVEERVNALLGELGLLKVAESKIGTPFIRGISGGEKKRVAIGTELVTDPSLLFLDEPTSGLDSSSAFNLLYCLKKLARGGRTIICTIHQPSSDLFALFDDLLLLTDQGDLAYFGPADAAVKFFKDDCGIKCGEFINPAEFMLKIVTSSKAEEDDTLDESIITSEVHKMKSSPEMILKNVETYKNSHIVDELIRKEIERFEGDVNKKSSSDLKVSFATTFWQQVMIVAHRGLICLIRDPTQGTALIIISVFFGILMGSLYYHIPTNQSGIGDRMGALFFLTMNGAFSNLGSLEVFLQEREIFVRERANKMYRTSSYFIGKVLPDLPQRLLPGFLFGAIAYFMMGLRSGAGYFFKFVLVGFLNTMMSYSLCLSVSSVAKNFALANLISPMIIVFLMLPSGFLVNLNNIPSYWIWLKYISFFNYAYEAILVNELAGLPLSCAPNEYKPANCSPATDPACVCPVTNGSDVITALGMSPSTYWTNIGILIGMICSLLVLAFVFLKYFQKEKR